MKTFSAVLLAGGESQRMGQDKAEVQLGGAPLWQLQLRKLRELEPIEVFVSLREDRSWRPADTTLLLDQAPSRGPLSGIAAALEQMRTTHLLVLAVDMPFVTTDDLRRLQRASQSGGGAGFRADDHVEPLAAIYPREAQGLSSAANSASALIRELTRNHPFRFLEIEGDAAQRFRSVNTPEDL